MRVFTLWVGKPESTGWLMELGLTRGGVTDVVVSTSESTMPRMEVVDRLCG